ncbi:MAG: isoprenyl transferase [Alphaproteobacteria bacterium]|nr:isoprenyl transferase [Alphaproteobacteria bacterium]
MDKKLKHIAIIMDGNGRWASKQGLPRSAGHKKGAETLQEIAKAVADMGIECMTVYAFSTENWKRDKAEVDYLMNLLRQYLKSELKEIKDRGARIKVIGERDMLAPDIIEQINNLEKETLNNDKFTFCIALSYGSRAEILSAVRRTSSLVAKGDLHLDDIDENMFSNMLYTSGIPDPDIVIRTSGEQRISNYLLWQLAYSELFFTKTLWPDFTVNELKEIINDFNSRERRYGKV